MTDPHQADQQQRSRLIVGAACALVIAVIIILLNKRDFDRDPATDTADVVATFAAFGGVILWFALRRLPTNSEPIRILAAAALGVAVGALVVGLGSVVYDPFAP